jgi:DNA-binding NarL/FixJ family response regulator
VENGQIRIALQSPRRMMREALAGCLRASGEFTVVGHTGSLSELGVVCVLRCPDLAVVDLHCPLSLVTDALDAVRALRERCPELRVIGLYERWTVDVLCAARQAGVAAVMPVSKGLDALLTLVREQAVRRQPRPDHARLTGGELDVVWLMNSGHSVAEMAELLRISRHTVENRKRSIYAKLDAHSHGAAVARSSALGILDSPGAVRRAVGAERQTRRGGDPRRPTVVLVRGPTGAATECVVRTLLSGDVACALDRGGSFQAVANLLRTCDGPVAAVLVAPVPAADALACESMGVPILMVGAQRVDRGGMVQAMLSGAAALVALDDVPAHLLSVLAVLTCGYVALGAEQARSALELLASAARQRRPELTARESDILASVERGESVRQTARALGIAEKTVENTQARLFRKLGVRNRVGALAVARQLGLVGSDLPPVSAGPA